MSQQYVNIAAVGLCTSMGGYLDSCAAYRAGLNRFAAHESMMSMAPGDDEPQPITVAHAAANLWCYQGVGRTVKLLEKAFKDLCENYRQSIPHEGLQLLLALPDPEDRALDMRPPPNQSRNDRLQAYIDAVTDPLMGKLARVLGRVPTQCVFGDRFAFARVLKKALDMFAKGQAQHCLVMVADSLTNDTYLDYQLETKLLKSGDNPVGYIPGEGAAVLLLSAAPSPDKNPCSMDAKISVGLDSSVVNMEDDDEVRAQWHGQKLAELIKGQLPHLYDKQWFPQQVCDLNGEERRALEYGTVQVKLRGAYPDAHFMEAQIPALGFGELGTMMGPMALATSMASLQRRYARHREFLITLSEDNGRRAVIHAQF